MRCGEDVCHVMSRVRECSVLGGPPGEQAPLTCPRHSWQPGMDCAWRVQAASGKAGEHLTDCMRAVALGSGDKAAEVREAAAKLVSALLEVRRVP